MISMRSFLFGIFVSLLLACGCSAGRDIPVTPDKGSDDLSFIPTIDPADTQNNRTLMGMWTLSFDGKNLVVTENVDRYPMRHWNVKPYISPSFNVLNIDPLTGVVDVEATLSNPIGMSGYDVRLIVYTDSYGSRLLNPDDWTSLYDISGGSQINPFRAFVRSGNREFGGHESHKERLQLWFPPAYPPIKLAIDVSLPSNCEEPYEITNFRQEILYSKAGSEALIEVDVYDWQSDVDEVSLWCPSITGNTSFIPFSQTEPNQWELILVNTTGADAGDYVGCIKATSLNSGSLALYDVIDITVTQYVEGEWPFAWGDVEDDGIGDVAVDIMGNVYATGIFRGTVDFDPGPSEWNLTSHGDVDAFLSKFDSTGHLLWAQSWGGGRHDDARKVKVDDNGNSYVVGYIDEANRVNAFYLRKFAPNGDNLWEYKWVTCYYYCGGEAIGVYADENGVYITGGFLGSVDFDPGPPNYPLSSNAVDIFLIKFDTEGNFLWANNWGDEKDDRGLGVVADSQGNIYVTGYHGWQDYYDENPEGCLLKYNSSGELQWGHLLYGDGNWTQGNEITIDDSQNLYVSGYFSGSTDFDPDPDSYKAGSSNGGYDAFLAKYNSSTGYLIWHRTWGGSGNDYAFDVEIMYNYLCIGGGFEGSVDLNPGGGLDQHVSCGSSDAYISKFDLNGGHLWGYSCGSTYWDAVGGVGISQSSFIYGCGSFQETVGFDLCPDQADITRTSNGGSDAFAVKLDTNGNLIYN